MSETKASTLPDPGLESSSSGPGSGKGSETDVDHGNLSGTHSSRDNFVRVHGAREHNLKNVHVAVPRNALVVFTGISGSGKSSLAFGTIYAEAQRRYLESVSPYARRLIDQVGVPDVDDITGLPPAVALQQARGTPGARSSVGSVSQLSGLLRMLYSRAGSYPAKQPMLYAEDFSPNTPQGACPHCHGLGHVYEVTEETMVPDPSLTIRERAIASWPPAWHGQNLRDILVTLGFDVDRPWRDLSRKDRDWILFTDDSPTVPVYAGFTPAETRAALRRKAEPSYQGTYTGARRYVLHTFATTQSALMKRRVARYMIGARCPVCDGKRLKPEALSVRFAGLDVGELSRLSLERIALLLAPAAAGRFDGPAGGGVDGAIGGVAGGVTSGAVSGTFGGAVGGVANGAVSGRGAVSGTVGGAVGGVANGAASGAVGGAVGGAIGGAVSRAVSGPVGVGGVSRAAARADTARRVAAGGSAHAASPDVRRTPNLSQEKRLAAQRIAQQVCDRIATLQSLGLGYLTPDRPTPTLSPGELQRLRLATQLRSQLFGVVYVLDEPTAGLHPSDGEALIAALAQLKDNGNSIFVVEHDLDVMRRADWLVDVGPLAGERGGEVLYSGPPAGLREVSASHTARYLFAGPSIRNRPCRAPEDWLELRGVTRNNLHGLDARIPLGVLCAVTGVSGSGKSSLVSQALVDLVSAFLGHEEDAPDDPTEADVAPDIVVATRGHLAAGAERIRRLVRVDQRPIGRTPRSNLATYTGLFDGVRKLFAATPAAKRRRYDAGRFSFNVAKGRCETCEGEGFVSVEMLFMPSVYAPCPTCRGARYNDKTLEVTWRGRTIAEVLGMNVEGALELFADEAAVRRPLELLMDVGLGYLRLGQPATELSGGEAQRIKLASELQRPRRGATLYVLDEPTTGLHPLDVDRLLAQLQVLVDSGNSVVVVEHEMRLVAASDWVIDMGPGAGEAGGRIVACGTPEQVARHEESRTARYLRPQLALIEGTIKSPRSPLPRPA